MSAAGYAVIWDRRPGLTTPAHALYRVAHLARRNQWGPARPKAASRQHSPERQPRGDIPKGGIAERFRIDVLEKSGRWAVGQRAARRRPLGRQPRHRWRTRPAPAAPAPSRLRAALAAPPGPLSAAAAGRLS